MANLDPHLLDELTEVIVEQLDNPIVTETVDIAIDEMFSQQGVVEVGQGEINRQAHAWQGRALLRAAEQQFILAMGGAEDISP